MLVDVQEAQFSVLSVCDMELLCIQGNEFKMSILTVRRLFRGYALFKQPFVSARLLKEAKLTFQQTPNVVWYPAPCCTAHRVFSWLLWEAVVATWPLRARVGLTGSGLLCVSNNHFFQYARPCFLGNHSVSSTPPKCKCLLKNSCSLPTVSVLTDTHPHYSYTTKPGLWFPKHKELGAAEGSVALQTRVFTPASSCDSG